VPVQGHRAGGEEREKGPRGSDRTRQWIRKWIRKSGSDRTRQARLETLPAGDEGPGGSRPALGARSYEVRDAACPISTG
jgi:hypothetical protein